VWQANVDRIINHNKAASTSESGRVLNTGTGNIGVSQLAINAWSDQTTEEWTSRHGGGYMPGSADVNLVDEVVVTPPSRLRRAQASTDGGWGLDALWTWPWTAPPALPTPTATSSASMTPYPSRPARVLSGTAHPAPSDSAAPSELPLPPGVAPSLDWTGHPSLLHWPVKSQQVCGACYAFSTIGAIEAALAIRTAAADGVPASAPAAPPTSRPAVLQVPRYSLSEQQILDCSNATCGGGGIRATYGYIKAAGGLCSDAAWPYIAIKQGGRCSSSSPKCGQTAGALAGWTNIARQSEAALIEALQRGPVVVAISAMTHAVQFYSSGVLDGGCGTAINHAVVAVGYGVEPSTGTPYFRLRNSWGEAWGEGGYFRIARGVRYPGVGQCGVLTDPSQPVLA
jgi:hypothetical protein